MEEVEAVEGKEKEGDEEVVVVAEELGACIIKKPEE